MTLSSVDRYDRDVLAANQLALVERVAPGVAVLELGASTGYMSRALRSKACHVTAIELDLDALEVLCERADEAHHGDLEDPGTLGHLDGRQFDVIVLADVLEHLRNPQDTLSTCRRWLKPNGAVLISMPNVAYWRVRLDLARGRWEMTRTGILDETHLRFFTQVSAESMFRSAGFTVDVRQPIWDAMPFDGRFRGFLGSLWSFKRRANTKLQDRFPDLFAYQFIWSLSLEREPEV